MTETPMRTFSANHPLAGYLEFTIPLHSPQDVESYLFKKLTQVPLQERLRLHEELMKQATSMWDAFALFVGDPAEARLVLRQDQEIDRWLSASA